MKELTTQEKAKAYDEAIKKIASKLKGFKEIIISRNDIEEIFPELKESEDDRIIKNIISWLKNIDGQTISINDYNSALVWLEKQSNQSHWKPNDYQMSCLEDAITSYKKRGFSADTLKSLYDDLKKLKDS